VPERKDDYAWENDRIAFRIYGPALQNTPGEVSGSGVDVWLKSTRRLVVDAWYAGGDYHTDHGEGVDAYKVGTTRGCGGLAIRVGGELGISANFASWRRLATGPIRTLAEFEYAPWTAGDRQVREVKRVALDRGSNLNRVESSLMAEPAGDLAVAVGLANRPGNGAVQVVEKEGWLTYTEPEAPPHGRTHTAVVFPGGLTMASEPTHWLATRVIKPGEPLVYYAGAGWDRYDFPTPEAWQAYVQLFAWNVAHPLEVQWKPAAP
jgi:unsaturated rhamnogalacturonyl hydrolase